MIQKKKMKRCEYNLQSSSSRKMVDKIKKANITYLGGLLH
jgi:hypothetical protein